jgi:hypothetical protein
VRGLFLLVLCMQTAQAIAQQDSEPIPSEAKKINYVLGLKFKTNDRFDSRTDRHWSPIAGIQLGRWKLGTNPNLDEWLAFSGIRKEPTLSYDFLGIKNWKLQASFRLQNLASNDEFEFSDKGKNTIRGRLLLSHRIADHVTAAAELTQDLLSRGDGTTFTLGLSRDFAISPKTLLVASTGVTWANATHWRTTNQAFLNKQLSLNQTNNVMSNLNAAPNPDVGAGVGGLGVGFGYRYGYSKQWAIYANTGFSRAIGEVQSIRGTQWRSSFQLGLLYFGQY